MWLPVKEWNQEMVGKRVSLDPDRRGDGIVTAIGEEQFLAKWNLGEFVHSKCPHGAIWLVWEEKKMWEPKEGEPFFRIMVTEDCLSVVQSEWREYPIYRQHLRANLIFRTREQAEEASRRIKETLDKLHEEIGE